MLRRPQDTQTSGMQASSLGLSSQHIMGSRPRLLGLGIPLVCQSLLPSAQQRLCIALAFFLSKHLYHFHRRLRPTQWPKHPLHAADVWLAVQVALISASLYGRCSQQRAGHCFGKPAARTNTVKLMNPDLESSP